MRFASKVLWICLFSGMLTHTLCSDDAPESTSDAEAKQEQPAEQASSNDAEEDGKTTKEDQKEPEPLKSNEEEEKSAEDHEFSDDELREIHSAVDENADKRMSKDELLKFTEKHHRHVELSGNYLEDELSRLDTNKDGYVSLQEYLNDTNPEGNEKEDESQLFAAADKDGDGKLDKEELSGLLSPEAEGPVMNTMLDISMKKTDANSDGKVTLKEFQDADLHHSEYAPVESEKDDDSTEKEDDGTELFNRLDANSDGVLEKSELHALHSGKVARETVVNDFVKELDKNGDNHVDAQELIEAKDSVQDSDLQSYLIAWAMHRPVIGR